MARRDEDRLLRRAPHRLTGVHYLVLLPLRDGERHAWAQRRKLYQVLG